MDIFILVVFLFATIRPLTYLVDKKNHNIGSYLVAITMVIAYIALLMKSVTII